MISLSLFSQLVVRIGWGFVELEQHLVGIVDLQVYLAVLWLGSVENCASTGGKLPLGRECPDQLLTAPPQALHRLAVWRGYPRRVSLGSCLEKRPHPYPHYGLISKITNQGHDNARLSSCPGACGSGVGIRPLLHPQRLHRLGHILLAGLGVDRRGVQRLVAHHRRHGDQVDPLAAHQPRAEGVAQRVRRDLQPRA